MRKRITRTRAWSDESWERRAQPAQPRRLNGWRRLWVVATVLAALWFLVFLPLKNFPEWDTPPREALWADYASGRCQAYIEAPLASLVKPLSLDKGSCWQIYTTRSVGEIDDVPFTREIALERETSRHRWEIFGVYLDGALPFLLITGGLYGLGALIAWIRRGFAQAG